MILDIRLLLMFVIIQTVFRPFFFRKARCNLWGFVDLCDNGAPFYFWRGGSHHIYGSQLCLLCFEDYEAVATVLAIVGLRRVLPGEVPLQNGATCPEVAHDLVGGGGKVYVVDEYFVA